MPHIEGMVERLLTLFAGEPVEVDSALRPVFKAFEEVLGPVGAAKCLHLLSRDFFPLWDRAIAGPYGCPLSQMGRNAERYWRFMEIVKEQVQSLEGEQGIVRNPLKAIDECNYCKHTKG